MPGGFAEEATEWAMLREAAEETGPKAEILKLVGVYSTLSIAGQS